MAPDPVRAAKRARAARKMTPGLTDDENADASKAMADRTAGIASRAKAGTPYTDAELDGVVNSLRNLAPADASVDWAALRKLLSEVAHISHKQWDVTGDNSKRMAGVLTPDGMSADARQIFERILHEGNWDGAVDHENAGGHGDGGKPWAVLVTGVNGIRKTTAMYQPWFPQLLLEALVAPPGAKSDFAVSALPNGENSFFRQLDHMITTLTNEDFAKLYALTSAQLSGDEPPKELITKYSDLKAGYFSRYRTLSELLGALLLREAQNVSINAMCETSGRDVAMFHYIDHFFPGGHYNKLALHFTVDDLSQAMQSVDARMVREILTGRDALATGDPVEVVYANAGGPYGSEVLAGVQADSDRVWDDVVMKGDTVGMDWYKATFNITAHPTEPWTIRAVRPDGIVGTVHTFGPPRTVG